jgi:hypothetical protein
MPEMSTHCFGMVIGRYVGWPDRIDENSVKNIVITAALRFRRSPYKFLVKQYEKVNAGKNIRNYFSC